MTRSENTLEWLLEDNNPCVRYLTLRDIVALPEDDPELQIAKERAHREGPIATILDAMDPDGFWVKPGAGYSGKYKSGVWSLIMLAQLGATVDMDERLHKACQYLMDHALSETGQFSTDGTSSGTVDCLQGNLIATLLDLGCDDYRLDKAMGWMARSITGDGIAPFKDKESDQNYFLWNCGPVFACRANNNQPCSWGGIKELLALGKIPENKGTPELKKAMQVAIDFFLTIDPLKADYPTRLGGKPDPRWWKFGFPVFYVSDIVQLVEALSEVGYANDPRLVNAFNFIENKQDENGRWNLEYDYKTWYKFGTIGQPNKWVTFRAVSVLKQVNEYQRR